MSQITAITVPRLEEPADSKANSHTERRPRSQMKGNEQQWEQRQGGVEKDRHFPHRDSLRHSGTQTQVQGGKT